jgi:DNA-binding MarR family transcriptional regulator
MEIMNQKDVIIQNIRSFNRFYTGLIGLLDGHLLESEYSLAEARILYEIHIGRRTSASQIMSALNIDKGYLSRMLKKLEKRGLITKKPSAIDARVSMLTLTDDGLEVFLELNKNSNDQIDALIEKLPLTDRQQLVNHMEGIVAILTQ